MGHTREIIQKKEKWSVCYRHIQAQVEDEDELLAH